MRTTVAIILILFVLAIVLTLVLSVNFFLASQERLSDKNTQDITDQLTKDTATTLPSAEQEPATSLEKKGSSIEKIEIYLDGTKEGGGIFIGEAEYGLDSVEAERLYGKKFLKSGYELNWDGGNFTFEPGTIHNFYVYAYIPETGWDYIKETRVVPGERNLPPNILFFIDTPLTDSFIEQNVNIQGWAVNSQVSDSPGISSIEFYLNGPRGFGKKIGNATLGISREDVASSTGNPSYISSGFDFVLSADLLEPESDNLLYCYAVSASGEINEIILRLKAGGERNEPSVIISASEDIFSQPGHGPVKISGWAISRKSFEENKETIESRQYRIKKIVFTSTKNGNEDIFSMNIDGSELTQLTDNPSNDMYPQISPDGKKILYTADINGTWQIMIMNADGTEKRQLTNGRDRSGFPTMTFEGRYIFYEVYIDNNWELYRMNADGTNQIRLTYSAGIDDWHPFAHPREFKVIYESGAIGNEDIYFMDYDGSNIKQVLDFPIRKRVPSISKDGKYILFSGFEQNSSSIFIMNSDGTDLRQLTDNVANNVQPSISWDNQYITFYSDITGNDEIYIMNSDGTDLRQLTDIPGDDWGPVFLYQE